MTFDMTVMMICSSDDEFDYWLLTLLSLFSLLAWIIVLFCMFLLLMSQQATSLLT